MNFSTIKQDPLQKSRYLEEEEENREETAADNTPIRAVAENALSAISDLEGSTPPSAFDSQKQKKFKAYRMGATSTPIQKFTPFANPARYGQTSRDEIPNLMKIVNIADLSAKIGSEQKKTNQTPLYMGSLNPMSSNELRRVKPASYLGSHPILDDAGYGKCQSKSRNLPSRTQPLSYTSVPQLPQPSFSTTADAINLFIQRQSQWKEQLDQLPSLGSCDKNFAIAKLQTKVQERINFYTSKYTQEIPEEMRSKFVINDLHEIDDDIVTYVQQKGGYHPARSSGSAATPYSFNNSDNQAIFIHIDKSPLTPYEIHAHLYEGSDGMETISERRLPINSNVQLYCKGNLQPEHKTRLGRMIDEGIPEERAVDILARSLIKEDLVTNMLSQLQGKESKP